MPDNKSLQEKAEEYASNWYRENTDQFRAGALGYKAGHTAASEEKDKRIAYLSAELENVRARLVKAWTNTESPSKDNKKGE
jgi:hypothetical protein